MRCSGVNTYESNYNGKKVVGGEVILTAVWSDDPKGDSKTFCDATPSGKLSLNVNNPAAREQFIPGEEYYISIEQAKK